MTLTEFNSANAPLATTLLTQCCAAQAWVAKMVNARPFNTVDEILNAAQAYWQTMDEANLLAAFSAHPKIGDVNSLHKKFANTQTLAANEQSGVNGSTHETLEALAQANEAYFQKFGFIFIVCATGKSAEHMLNLLNQRLPNNHSTELKNAAREQAKITALRLQKLFN